MNSDFFALMSRMKYINRWGLMRNSYPENIEGHSLQVAMIAHALALVNNKIYGGNISPEKVAVYGLYHDANEILTGDMPTPIKYYNPKIRDAYKNVEETSKNKLVSMLPEELKESYKEIFFFEKFNKECYYIVKAADRISAYIKCVEELKAGNMEFKEAVKSIKESIHEYKIPEVEYFMEHFMHGFELSLDEINF